jgi:alkaline phosphatase D
MPALDTPIDRRTFLKRSLAGAAVWVGWNIPSAAGLSEAEAADAFAVTGGDPYAMYPLSVASGDPRPNGIVLWTRLQPQSVDCARVCFEISATSSFADPVLRGSTTTTAGKDWTVKAQVNHAALRPNRVYYYRFIRKGVASRTGRFRTLPSTTTRMRDVRFAFMSCQDYTNGYYTALPYLAQEDVDFVVHLGDYIYESVGDASFQGSQVRPVRLPSGRDRAEDLSDYRYLYRKYKSDRNLQRVHERFAFISIWDDHEFANDCYREYDTDTADPASNRDPQRRSDANRAWAEYTPTGIQYDRSRPATEELKIYRSFKFGDLLELIMTDERLYRDAHPCGVSTSQKYFTPGCANRTNPQRSMLGRTQREWFLDRLQNSTRTWKIWGNEVMVMQLKVLNTYLPRLFPERQMPAGPAGGVFLNLDQWDGWPVERDRILGTIRDRRIRNVVTITGDIHTFFAGYQRVNFDNPLEPPVATCYICGSVTSANLEELASMGEGGPPLPPNRGDLLTQILQASNPHIRYANSSGHGYCLMEVTPQAITTTMKSVDTIRQPTARLFTLRTFRQNVNETVIRDAVTGLPV